MAKKADWINVTLTGNKEFETFLADYPRKVRREVKQATQDTGARIIELAQINLERGSGKYGTPAIDLGQIYNSFRIELKGIANYDPLGLTVTNPAKHAPYVEYGTAPHFPPPQALAGWASRHGFSTDPGTLFVLARAIAENPQPARPFFAPAGKQAIVELQEKIVTIISTYKQGLKGG